MKFYTKTKGIGGRIKQRIEDFKVEEIPKKTFPLHEKLKPIDKNYTVFWMEKFNWDTTGALMAISKRVGVSVSSFNFAGTKDKRAVTKQLISTSIPENKLKSVNIKDIKLYGFSRGRRLELGDLDGNNFEIAIRDISLDEKELEKRLSSIESELIAGVPNFFGPQRFGITRPVTHLIGKELVKGNVEEALKIYLCKVFEGEAEESKKARSFLSKSWNKKGFNQAMKIFPDRLRYEKIIIEHLSVNPSDFTGAFRKLPKKLRKLFPNAVQSWIFNRTLKKLWPVDRELPIVGYNTILRKDNLSGLIKKILKEERISLSDFKLKAVKDMKCSGGLRRSMLIPKDFSWKIDNDEINPDKRKVIIKFSLPSGSYATIILGEIMKN